MIVCVCSVILSFPLWFSNGSSPPGCGSYFFKSCWQFLQLSNCTTPTSYMSFFVLQNTGLFLQLMREELMPLHHSVSVRFSASNGIALSLKEPTVRFLINLNFCHQFSRGLGHLPILVVVPMLKISRLLTHLINGNDKLIILAEHGFSTDLNFHFPKLLLRIIIQLSEDTSACHEW